MSWVIATLLALACFAGFALLFRVPRKGCAIVLAALALGLVGFGVQASPSLPGAPKAPSAIAKQEGWRIVELRQALVGNAHRSRSAFILTADALVRQGQFENAANLLRGVVHNNPNDGDAWLALGNALTFHAGGRLTPAALFAYNHAARELPESGGPAFFVGLALVRQGKLVDARELWAKGLAAMPEDAPGRELLVQRLAQLDELMRQIARNAGKQGR
jgi:cytochrome c-type biogenesis protein CcmH